MKRVATFITLLLVPVIYSTFMLDLKHVKWEEAGEAGETATVGQTGVGGLV
jgi:hypothetical protein